jgi:hypothetical protein
VKARCCLANHPSRRAAERRVTAPYLSDPVTRLDGKIGNRLVTHGGAGCQHQIERFGIEVNVDCGDFLSFAEDLVHGQSTEVADDTQHVRHDRFSAVSKRRFNVFGARQDWSPSGLVAIMGGVVSISGLVIMIMMLMHVVFCMIPMIVMFLCRGRQAKAECSDDGDVFY